MSRILCGTKAMVLAIAGTVLIAPLSYAKHASFDMPACEKLLQGDGPTESEPVATPAAAPAAVSNDEDAAPKVEKPKAPASSAKKADPPKAKKKGGLFSPMKLTDDKESFEVGADGKMKLEVQQNTEAQPPSGGAEAKDPTASTSVVEGKLKKGLHKDEGEKLVKPLALRADDDEAEKTENTITEAERNQLSDLWTSCINRSPDIQFVINKLQPGNEDGAHATATALKMIGGALFNVACVAPMMMPGANMGTYMATSGGANIMQNLMGSVSAKNGKKQQISQEQATMLYKIVRDTAEKVVYEYRQYRENRSQFNRANSDLEDLKAMVASASGKADPATAIQMEYTIRKAQRDVDKIIDDAKLHKQQLVDLSGPDAVGHLDAQMDAEQEALAKLVGGQENAHDVSNPPLKETGEGSIADSKQKPQQIAQPPGKQAL